MPPLNVVELKSKLALGAMHALVVVDAARDTVELVVVVLVVVIVTV